MESCPPVEALLRCLGGQAVYFEPLSGNNGDTLIRMGSTEALRRARVRLIRRPSDADFILINGSGGMTPLWGALGVLARYSANYPAVPLAVLPSSWLVEPGDLVSALRGRTAVCYLYAREHPSFMTLRRMEDHSGISVGLDHDMAFHLRNSDFLRELQQSSQPRHVLVAERRDAEGRSSVEQLPKPTRVKRVVRRLTTPRIRRSVARLLSTVTRPFITRTHKKIWSETDFARLAVRRALADYPQSRNLPVVAEDISDSLLFSFKHFRRIIAEAAVVFTNRLHVAILSTLLNKPTYVDRGAWHKILGVYDFSLRSSQCVHLLEWTPPPVCR